MPGVMLRRVGLTGGIGSGKSTVAGLLATCGACVVDADAIARQLTAVGGAAIALIAQQFGPQALTFDGAMDREVMRQRVFDDVAVRRQLEAIVHPLVSLEAARQAEQAARAGCVCIVFDIPLLVESGRWRQQLDQVLVVDCSEATQISRVMARSGWTREAVQKVVAGQASRAQRRAAADVGLYNEGLPLEALGPMVVQISRGFGL